MGLTINSRILSKRSRVAYPPHHRRDRPSGYTKRRHRERVRDLPCCAGRHPAQFLRSEAEDGSAEGDGRGSSIEG